MPVEITLFTAVSRNDLVELQWNTATENNNAGFEVMRKEENDLDFKVITYVTGNGMSNAPITYKYLDTVIVSGTYKYQLRQIDHDGKEKYSHTVEIQISLTPTVYSLSQNYPNPFNPATTIRYGLPSSSRVSLKIYNTLGQQVEDLIDAEQSAGWHEAVWKANVSSGLYFYRIDAISILDPNNRFTQLKKMIFMK